MTDAAGTPLTESTATVVRVPRACLVAARAADSKQAVDTVVLSMTDTLGVTDAFLVASGRNTRQVRTIMDEVERLVKVDAGRAPVSVEGRDDFGWVLMDYGDFVVHVFLEDKRSYYDLEHLWGDAPRVDWLGVQDDKRDE